jgi:phospholipid/cholesterol/gamma-HCH transport system ATP-binding protein
MATEQENIVEVRGLHVGFNDHVVLEDLDLEVHLGEVLGIVGGSGSGKSVLLQTILGLLRPRAGSVRVFGQGLSELGPLERRSLQRRWGVLFQDAALFSSLTLADNVRRVITEHADVPEPLLGQLVRLKVSMVGSSKRHCRNIRPSSPAACASRRGWPARSPSIPRSCSSMSRPPVSTRWRRPRSRT